MTRTSRASGTASGGSTRAPVLRRGHVRRHAAGRAAAVVRAARHDRGAPRARAWPPTRAAAGTNYDWWQEFSAQATGLGTTFVPVDHRLRRGPRQPERRSLDNQPLAATIAGVTAAWLVLWSFLTGGVLDRYARGRPTRAHGFFAACGTHFWRLLRLGCVGLARLRAAVRGACTPWIFERRLSLADARSHGRADGVRDPARRATPSSARCWSPYNLVFDYARIRIVVEDRRSALGALMPGRGSCAAIAARLRLYLLNGAAYLCARAGLRAAGAGRAAVGCADVAHAAARPALHPCAALSEAAVLCVGDGVLPGQRWRTPSYTAAPAVVWPDSPAAEASR